MEKWQSFSFNVLQHKLLPCDIYLCYSMRAQLISIFYIRVNTAQRYIHYHCYYSAFHLLQEFPFTARLIIIEVEIISNKFQIEIVHTLFLLYLFFDTGI